MIRFEIRFTRYSRTSCRRTNSGPLFAHEAARQFLSGMKSVSPKDEMIEISEIRCDGLGGDSVGDVADIWRETAPG